MVGIIYKGVLLYISSKLHVQYYHINSLDFAMVGVFTTQNWHML